MGMYNALLRITWEVTGMKQVYCGLRFIVLLSFVVGGSFAQDLPLGLELSGNHRLRYETLQNYDFIYNRPAVDGHADNDDDRLLSRFRLYLDLKPCPGLEMHVTFQDSREFGSELIDHDVLDRSYKNGWQNKTDIHEAWLKLQLGDCPAWLQVGRMQMNYGDHRLLSGANWGNNARAFDVVKLIWQQGDMTLDLFAGNVVQVDSNAWDHSNENDDLLGAYASIKNLPQGTQDVYFLYRDNEDTDREIYTVGTRIDGKSGAYDWNMEGAYQWGSVRAHGDNDRHESIDHEAWAVYGEVGYTCQAAPRTPRLCLGYAYATGDGDPHDDENNTFDQLFPSNHARGRFGHMDRFSWRNMHCPAVKLSWNQFDNLKIQTNWHFFWLDEEDTDAWYSGGGAAIRNANGADVSKFVGHELDIAATYTISDRASLELGYSHFFANDYVRDTAVHAYGTDDADDADFFYAQAVWTF